MNIQNQNNSVVQQSDMLSFNVGGSSSSNQNKNVPNVPSGQELISNLDKAKFMLSWPLT